MNESTNECEGKSKARDSVEQKECRVQRYDPKGMQIELVRKEHLALVIGGILPLLVAITNYVAFSGRILTGAPNSA